MRLLFRYAIWFVAALVVGGGCGSEVADNELAGTADNVVARVADTEITVEELLQFRADTPALLHSEKEGVEALKDYLQTLIDIELILLEAETLKLEQDADFVRRWEEERKRKLIFEYQLREIMGKVEVSPEQMMQRYAKSKWSRMVQLARIRVKTREEVEQVVRELEQGGDFAGLALEWSVDQKTARRGGRLDYFLGRNELAERGFSLEIAEELFELEVGAFSRPYRKGSVYEIFQVVDQRPAPPGYAMVFARTRLAQEFYTRRRALLDTLSREYQVHCEPGAIALAMSRLSVATRPLPPLAASEEEQLLCQLSDGWITVGELYDVYRKVRSLKPSPVDSAAVAKSIRDHLLPEALFYRAALQKGIAQDSLVAAWLATKKQGMLVETVKERVVDRKIDLSEDALRRYYEDHADRFAQKAEIHLVEILLQTQEEAEELLRQVSKGESMEDLAVHHSIRKEAQRIRGRLHLHADKRGLYGELYAAAAQADEGVLQGPVKIDSVTPGGYSIFEVVEKAALGPQPFVQVASRARYWLRQEEEARILQMMFQEFRDKYAARIEIFEEHLKKMTFGS